MSENARDMLVGIDVGGTFTDVFTIDQSTGQVSVHKVPSTRGRESDGFLAGIEAATDDAAAISAVIHGTTVGTNALLERKGAQAGLIATEGFRDILQMRRRDRPTTWGLWGRYDPVIPRVMSFETGGRILADGTQHRPFDEEGFRTAVRALIDRGAESIAVVFVNAHASNEHEAKARAILDELWPNEHISISSELLPEIREFERASTTALNAYLQPPVGNYLRTLDSALRDRGFAGEFLIVQSNGGLTRAGQAARTPFKTALSGPAAGVHAAACLASGSGFENVITCDMGGTSFDISLVAEGRASQTAQASVDFGLVIRSPMTEITTIGAGGGSIASVDAGGILQIGPESAGSVPGPVCYGQGNRRPTVTDANVMLGRIDAANPIGGVLKRLDVEAARAAIEKEIAEPLGIPVLEAAEAIIDVANARMCGAIRLVSIERGHDPRHFTAMPFGGGGALHSCAIVQEIGLASALVPRFPGVVSALGCVIADMRQDFVRTINTPLDRLDIDVLRGFIAEFQAEGEAGLSRTRAKLDRLTTTVALDMLYAGQSHTVDVEIASNGLDRDSLLRAFEQRYQQSYGLTLEGVPPVVVNLRVAVIGERPKFDLATLAPASGLSVEKASKGIRQVWFRKEFHDASVFDRLALPVGVVIEGPAILEQPDATVWIEPEFAARVDKIGNIVIERKEGA